MKGKKKALKPCPLALALTGKKSLIKPGPWVASRVQKIYKARPGPDRKFVFIFQKPGPARFEPDPYTQLTFGAYTVVCAVEGNES